MLKFVCLVAARDLYLAASLAIVRVQHILVFVRVNELNLRLVVTWVTAVGNHARSLKQLDNLDDLHDHF